MKRGTDGKGIEIEGIPPMALLPSGCWVPLTRARTPKGYIDANVYGVRDRLHRHAYRLFVGPLSAEDVVRHTCDVRDCCNPAHLLKGSQADNVADRVARGRTARGERHGFAKLTDADARAVYADRTTPAKEQAAARGVSARTIRNVWNGVTYRDATADLRGGSASADA